MIRDVAYNHVSDKDMSESFWNLCIRFEHIDAITNSTIMMVKEKNENAIIMKCYANYEF